ncbi:MAG: DUF349 domain-containing protein [Rikenellaceae bacterium]
MEILENTSEECFAGKSRAELVALLERLLEKEPIESLRRTVEAIKIAFYKAPRADEQSAEGVVEEQQRPTEVEAPEELATVEKSLDAEEIRLKELIREYRTRRDAFLTEQDQIRDLNLRTKLQIIDELKELTESDETLNHTFNKFRELQERWRATGQVPVQNMKDIWERYHLYTENFYAVIKINRELRDLDLKKNLEAKTQLCEAAEALLSIENPVDSFQKLQPLHDQWREIGPVDVEVKESIWLRFKEASSIINKRHLDHFESLKSEQANNLERKEALCAKVAALTAELPTSHKDWTAASEALLQIQAEWKRIGFAPKKDNTRVYNELREACDAFFAAKRDFYSGAKSEMEQNLERKRALCEAAEALSSSEDWKSASAELIKLQAEWKRIGTVSRRHSDQIWKRFRAACDLFFERKSAHFAGQDNDQNENLQRKEALLSEMESAIASGFDGVEAIKAFQRRWSEIGFVPMKQKDALQTKYKEVVDKMFSTMRGEERERNMGAFRNRVGSMKSEGGNGRMKSEREKLANKLKQLTTDINQLENNIGFFSRSKGAESMIADVNKKIEKARREYAETKEKIKMIDLASRE